MYYFNSISCVFFCCCFLRKINIFSSLFQIQGDLEDLESVLGKPQKSRVFGSGSCSALIKLFPGNKDLYVSHDTWSTYQSMLRILKRYNFAYHSNGIVVPGSSITFSSYPGWRIWNTKNCGGKWRLVNTDTGNEYWLLLH